MGSFVKNSLFVLTKVLLFSIHYIRLQRICCPYRKENKHNFIDGRTPLLTSGEADFGDRTPQINFCFGSEKCPLSWFHWRRKGVANNKPDALSYPKQMYNVLFFVLQPLFVLKLVNVALSRTPTSDFLSTICCVEENYLSLSSLLVNCNFVDCKGDQINLQLCSRSFASTSFCSVLCFRCDNPPHGCSVHTANLDYR